MAMALRLRRNCASMNARCGSQADSVGIAAAIGASGQGGGNCPSEPVATPGDFARSASKRCWYTRMVLRSIPMRRWISCCVAPRLWSRWQADCPLAYASPNAPSKADVLGTWMLSVLSGHKRYSHVTTIRCDGVNPGLLGMNKVISEDALRRVLAALPEAEGVAWLDGHLGESVSPLLDAPWILDIDTTIKPLYGKQEGAVVSYNPKKPGRPSHSYHTYLMAGLRLVLGVEVKAGNEHTGSHSLPGLLQLLDGLPLNRRPKIVRGDCGFGSDRR